MTPSPMPYRPEPAATPAEAGPERDTTVPALDYTDAGVPTLDHVRDRIEGRHATALGGAELAAESAQGRARQQTDEDRERAAAAALARIRASIRPADGRP
ncbi:hypothetical protein JL107_09165 [Nakamurella flavida]|uniref:Uncharacterized protein n=1 Tax=Nakamurella flavida TaxID=363630 RepID=A0A939C2I3_9ACTN|nr:hypothetical protein [Nakamurella flavida]MBM9476610.1 hypothetical protein [Nakamurella flavida]MDP9778952.1 phage shock protein A [Nakamurella flavida]